MLGILYWLECQAKVSFAFALEEVNKFMFHWFLIIYVHPYLEISANM